MRYKKGDKVIFIESIREDKPMLDVGAIKINNIYFVARDWPHDDHGGYIITDHGLAYFMENKQVVPYIIQRKQYNLPDWF